jgi:iron complex transport system ATP-binding protein
MVELRDVSYHAGATAILRDISVKFQPGRMNVVLGPNGAGKSTLLRIATGLVPPSSGSVLYGERHLASFDQQELARRRAVLTQHVELAFPLPVADVVMMGRYPHFGRVPTAHDREIVHEAVGLVGMGEKKAQPYPTLSGGEQQKVQLARVLAQIWETASPTVGARSPRYLFLDEPTTNLDVHYQLHVLSVAKTLINEHTTLLAILHDLNVAFQFGDHFVLLDRGRAAFEAASAREIPMDVLERVFDVRARPITDSLTKEVFWRFHLP